MTGSKFNGHQGQFGLGVGNEMEKVEGERPRKRKRNKRCKKQMQNPDHVSQRGHGRF